MIPNVWIMRGIPGSGKSTWIEKNFALLGTLVCSADHFRMIDGKYVFESDDHDRVHRQCQAKFLRALVNTIYFAPNGYNDIIVDNTNLRGRWFGLYIEAALAFDCPVTLVEISCDPEKAFVRQTHGVTLDKIKDMNKIFDDSVHYDYPGIMVRKVEN